MNYIKNKSTGDTWEANGLTYTEIICQEYGLNNCKFSAGWVEGHPVDTVYLMWERDGDPGATLLLRPDELAAIAWVANGMVWKTLLDQHLETADEK